MFTRKNLNRTTVVIDRIKKMYSNFLFSLYHTSTNPYNSRPNLHDLSASIFFISIATSETTKIRIKGLSRKTWNWSKFIRAGSVANGWSLAGTSRNRQNLWSHCQAFRISRIRVYNWSSSHQMPLQAHKELHGKGDGNLWTERKGDRGWNMHWGSDSKGW